MRTLLLVHFVLLVPTQGFCTTYLINSEGTGQFATIQEAIDAVDPDDVVELADGTYKGVGNRDADFLGKAITVRSQSGNPENCIVDCQGSISEYRRGFIFQSGEGPGSLLEGITITNGFMSGPSDLDKAGGGALCLGSAPRFKNCRFVENHAEIGGALLSDTSLDLTECVFLNNTAVSAGAVFALGQLALRDCVFMDNTADFSAGAIGVGTLSGTLNGCVFSGNSALADEALEGGGGLYCVESTLELWDCTFTDNEALRVGGGIYADNSTLALVRCEFSGNSASSIGGAVWCEETSISFQESSFTQNSAPDGGGLACSLCPNTTLEGCWFQANEAENGGGILCSESPISLTACTFWDNTAVWGAALLSSPYSDPVPRFIGCTLVGNSNTGLGGVLTSFSALILENTIIAFSSQGKPLTTVSPATLSCCNLFGNQDGDWVGDIQGQLGMNGNISADPLFCDAPTGHFELAANSPCRPFSIPNAQCNLIGAAPVACSAVANSSRSWSEVKTMFDQ